MGAAVIILNTNYSKERSGSVVECLTRDREAAGSSLIRITVAALEQDTYILA